jgi:hypothetical protein
MNSDLMQIKFKALKRIWEIMKGEFVSIML